LVLLDKKRIGEIGGLSQIEGNRIGRFHAPSANQSYAPNQDVDFFLASSSPAQKKKIYSIFDSYRKSTDFRKSVSLFII
jgi:hypothetical protein